MHIQNSNHRNSNCSLFALMIMHILSNCQLFYAYHLSSMWPISPPNTHQMKSQILSCDLKMSSSEVHILPMNMWIQSTFILNYNYLVCSLLNYATIATMTIMKQTSENKDIVTSKWILIAHLYSHLNIKDIRDVNTNIIVKILLGREKCT